MVDGSMVQAMGWGGILIALGTTTYMLSPVFHCPQNPKNTFTPTTVLTFSNFKRAIVDTHKRVVLIDNNNTRHDIITTQDNDLDFATLQIVMMNPDATLSYTNQIDNSKISSIQPSINALVTKTEKPSYRPILHPRTIEYYVLMHKLHSPRDQAIHTINTVLNNRYQPFLIGAQRKANMIQKSLAKDNKTSLASLEHINDHPVVHSTHCHEIVQPIMNKLSRSAKSYYTRPLQQYQRLHLSCLHTFRIKMTLPQNQKVLKRSLHLLRLTFFNFNDYLSKFTRSTA